MIVMKNIKMILTNGFDPDPRVYKEAKTLVQAGHDVEILCWDRENRYLDKEDEIVDGIKIKRFFPKSKYGSGYKQIRAYKKFIKEVKDYLKDKKYDAIHCHDFDGLFVGNKISGANKNIKFVYDEHDLFYQYFMGRDGFINQSIYKYIVRKEKAILKNVDTHIVVTPNMAKLYNESDNIIIINNAPYEQMFKFIEKEKHDKIVIGFIGSVRHFNELKTLIDSSGKFKDYIDILIAGRGVDSERLKNYCVDNNFSNVIFTGAFEMTELESLYKKIDITYLIYPKTAVVSMPNKFFESIITETPIIADVNTEFGKIANDERFGFMIDSNKEIQSQLEDIFRQLIKNESILKDFKANMNKEKYKYYWENNVKTLLSIYDD